MRLNLHRVSFISIYCVDHESIHNNELFYFVKYINKLLLRSRIHENVKARQQFLIIVLQKLCSTFIPKACDNNNFHYVNNILTSK